jgi:hypothetical protein
MKQVTLTVNKGLVYNEVAKTTAYTGAKQLTDDDKEAYKRIFTTNADQLMLERYFIEASNALTKEISPYLHIVSSHPASNGVDDKDYVIVIEIADTWPDALKDATEGTMFSFFVNYIVSMWYLLQKKAEASDYMAIATELKSSMTSLLIKRVQPVRRKPRPF